MDMDMNMENDDACKTGRDSEEKMVKFELEAAEALAGLASSAMPEEEQERPSQRLKHASPSQHNSMTRPCDGDRDLDLPQQDRAIVIQERSEKVSNLITKTARDEKNNELRPGGACFTNYPSVSGCKSRQPLTEIEKEARRLHRVLANRESARQTIWRRQAMFEELTRKAVDLALENESLKREKELAVKEYDSLKNTNDCLKAQMAKMVKPTAEEIPRESNLIHAECSASSSSRTPLSPSNQTPAVPLHWPPPIIQPLDATLLQSRSLSDITNPSLFPMTHTRRPELFSNQRDSIVIANPGTLLYVMPFPCFFPLSSATNALHTQSSNQNDRQNETYLNNHCIASSSPKNTVHGEASQPSLSLKVKTEASNSTLSIPADDVNQAGFGFRPDGGGGNRKGTYPNRMVFMPTPLSCVRPSNSVGSGLNTTPQQNNTSTNVEAIASSTGKSENGVSEEYQETVVYSSKKLVDASTAAEARRRKRKELMKLKSLRAAHQ